MHIPLSDELLAESAYQARFRLRGYTCSQTALGAFTVRDAANVLIRAKPEWTRADHARLAALHEQAAELQYASYSAALDGAALETWGRLFQVLDYRVCCIASEEFSEKWKDVLRYHGYSGPKHRILARAHQAASTSRRIR